VEQGNENPPGSGSDNSTLRSIAPYLTMGIQLAIPVVLFFFLGKWLDGKFGTSPWLMLAGLMLGAVGGMIKFIRSVMQLAQHQDALDAERKQHKKV
jgi:F0F1-type ATP synthase assembly protein I